MQMSALFGTKNFGFFEINGVSRTDKWEEGWASVNKGGREGGQFFVILCVRLMDGSSSKNKQSKNTTVMHLISKAFSPYVLFSTFLHFVRFLRTVLKPLL